MSRVKSCSTTSALLFCLVPFWCIDQDQLLTSYSHSCPSKTQLLRRTILRIGYDAHRPFCISVCCPLSYLSNRRHVFELCDGTVVIKVSLKFHHAADTKWFFTILVDRDATARCSLGLILEDYKYSTGKQNLLSSLLTAAQCLNRIHLSGSDKPVTP